MKEAEMKHKNEEIKCKVYNNFVRVPEIWYRVKSSVQVVRGTEEVQPHSLGDSESLQIKNGCNCSV